MGRDAGDIALRESKWRSRGEEEDDNEEVRTGANLTRIVWIMVFRCWINFFMEWISYLQDQLIALHSTSVRGLRSYSSPFSYSSHLCISILSLTLHQGNCKGVGSVFGSPIVTSAVPISLGPLGAQYCPLFPISSFSVHSTRLLAASSGVTAPPSSQYLSNPTPFVISVLINPGCTILIITPSS